MNAVPEATHAADGVLVVSAWEGGAAGRLLVRCTMTPGTPGTSGDDEPVTQVVSSVAELHAVVDSWIKSFTS